VVRVNQLRADQPKTLKKRSVALKRVSPTDGFYYPAFRFETLKIGIPTVE
jgi:hypothetical protein